MVHVTKILAHSKNKWVDSLRVYVKGGHGGNGLPKLGGVGGKGGDVYIVPSSNVKDLSSVYGKHFKDKKQRIVASAGGNSTKSRILGESGEDITLNVPLGIQIVDDHRKILGDLNKEDVKVRVVQGGNGGNLANGWLGQTGQSRHIRLDLKIIADIGIIGFPNAGKSTLLKAISRAKPKIASYPFTTIKPNLGEVFFPKDMRKFTLADLPGLIEGASYNVGMGHRFLKHVERTRLLLFLVDVEGFQLHNGGTHRTAFETVVLLNRELELFNPDLLDKPSVIVFNKMDKVNSKENFEKVNYLLENYPLNGSQIFDAEPDLRPTKFLKFEDSQTISAKHSPNSVNKLKNFLREKLDILEDLRNPNLKSEDEIRQDLLKLREG